MGTTASEIATSLGASLLGAGDHEVARAVHPEAATEPTDLAVALNKDLVPLLSKTKAGAAILPAGLDVPEGAPGVLITIPLSRSSLPKTSELFCFKPGSLQEPGVHPTAHVEEGAEIDPSARIGPFCYIAKDTAIGSGTILVSHCTVLPGSTIGRDGLLYSGVRIGPKVVIGDRVVIQGNANVGSDGFSFIPVDPGNVETVKKLGRIETDPEADASLMKVQSLGGIVIEDDVEIGAQTAIDAGTLLPTRVGRGSKIDNLTHIGHNVQVGEDCLICGQVAVAGSTTIGNRVVLAGGVKVADHVTIGEDVVVAGGSGVGTNLHPGVFYSGLPAVRHSETIKNILNVKRLDRIISKVLNPPAS
ncbi:MAG: UDP-3-O-(3-hydroxymyristoyl)glucosamine N-acyltransferase [Roseibacillus sp.]